MHLFIRTEYHFLKTREKRRKTKKTRENLGFFGWHLFCQLVLRCVDKKDALLIFIVFSYFTQNYDMHNNCYQYKRYTASI